MKCKALCSGQCFDDYFCECYIRMTKDGDNYYESGRPCRWPRLLRNAIMRRKQYLIDFLYDPLLDKQCRLHEIEEKKVYEKVKNLLQNYILCKRDSKNGSLVECEKDELLAELSMEIIEMNDEIPPALSKRWAELLRDTLKAIPFNLKSYFYKKA